MTYVTNFTVSVGWRNQYCGIYTAELGGVTYYLLDNEYYFKRKGLYGFYDDGERFAYFSRAILEMLLYIDFVPDVIHTNDWQTALVCVYLNLYYRQTEKFSQIKTAFTIHNIQYQGKYGMDLLGDVLSIGPENAHLVEYDGCVNYMKGAIECADKVTTVSPTYAYEIMDPWYAHGLDTLLREKSYKTCGILNGIDTEIYDPATDTTLAENYDRNTFEAGKPACKAALRQMFKLEENDQPLIGMVTRLNQPQGAGPGASRGRIHCAVGHPTGFAGSGDYMYESFLTSLRPNTPAGWACLSGLTPSWPTRCTPGPTSLMPSKSEPCGLAQMVALRYGTIPIVRETGGLKDSIQDSGDGLGNGFTFKSYNAHDMLDACLRAKAGYDFRRGGAPWCGARWTAILAGTPAHRPTLACMKKC